MGIPAERAREGRKQAREFPERDPGISSMRGIFETGLALRSARKEESAANLSRGAILRTVAIRFGDAPSRRG
jgi:hypothetical protein